MHTLRDNFLKYTKHNNKTRYYYIAFLLQYPSAILLYYKNIIIIFL